MIAPLAAHLEGVAACDPGEVVGGLPGVAGELSPALRNVSDGEETSDGDEGKAGGGSLCARVSPTVVGKVDAAPGGGPAEEAKESEIGFVQAIGGDGPGVGEDGAMGVVGGVGPRWREGSGAERIARLAGAPA